MLDRPMLKCLGYGSTTYVPCLPYLPTLFNAAGSSGRSSLRRPLILIGQPLKRQRCSDATHLYHVCTTLRSNVL